MALSTFINWGVLPASGSDNNGIGFDPSQTAGMLTDGAATVATGTAPVFSSASYNFVSGDIGAYVYIAAGTNWIPGWYKIASVASNQATLSATAAQGTLAGGTLTTVNGCATTASPTGATWTIDYSQQASAQVTFTDLVIGATTTQLTSVLNPFGKQWVGNILQVTSGSGFTTGFYTIASVSSVTATMDRSVGTGASTGGHAGMGGMGATLAHLFGISTAATIPIPGNVTWIKGTLTIAATQYFAASSNVYRSCWRGYGTYRGDSTHAEIACSTNSVNLVTFPIGCVGVEIAQVDLVCTAGTPGIGIRALGNNCENIALKNVVISGCLQGIEANYAVDFLIEALFLFQVEIKNCTSDGIQNSGVTIMDGCYIHGNAGNGYLSESGSVNQGILEAEGCVFAANGVAIDMTSSAATAAVKLKNCALYGNTGDGLKLPTPSGTQAQALWLMNNVIYGNGGIGIDFQAIGSNLGFAQCVLLLQQSNAFGANTGGDRTTGAPSDPTDIALSANPFNSPSTGDFSLNSTAGGGAALTGTGWQSTIL